MTNHFNPCPLTTSTLCPLGFRTPICSHPAHAPPGSLGDQIRPCRPLQAPASPGMTSPRPDELQSLQNVEPRDDFPSLNKNRTVMRRALNSIRFSWPLARPPLCFVSGSLPNALDFSMDAPLGRSLWQVTIATDIGSVSVHSAALHAPRL